MHVMVQLEIFSYTCDHGMAFLEMISYLWSCGVTEDDQLCMIMWWCSQSCSAPVMHARVHICIVYCMCRDVQLRVMLVMVKLEVFSYGSSMWLMWWHSWRCYSSRETCDCVAGDEPLYVMDVLVELEMFHWSVIHVMVYPGMSNYCTCDACNGVAGYVLLLRRRVAAG